MAALSNPHIEWQKSIQGRDVLSIDSERVGAIEFRCVVEVLYMRTIEEISATQYEGLRAQPLARVSRHVIRLGRRQRLHRTGTEVEDCVCAMGEHHLAQTAAIRRGTWHRDKRLAVS